MPINKLAKRFNLKACILYRWVSKLDKVAPDHNVMLTKTKKFKKMHERSKDFIWNYLEEAKVPIQAKALRDAVKSEVKLSVS